MFAKNQRFHLRGREFQIVRDERTKTGRVEHCAEAVNLLPGQSEALNREMRQNIHRIRNYENVSVLAHARGFDAVEDLHEQSDVTIDEIEARFIGLAT